MSILHIRHVILAVAGLAVLTVACSAPAPTTPKGSGDDDQTASGEKKSSDSPKASQVPTPAGPTTTTSSPTDPANTNANANGDQGDDPAAEQCWNTCIAANPTAQALSTQMDACYEKCGDTDTACETSCDNQSDQLCSSQANEAACNAIDQCDTKCFPNEGGGAEN